MATRDIIELPRKGRGRDTLDLGAELRKLRVKRRTDSVGGMIAHQYMILEYILTSGGCSVSRSQARNSLQYRSGFDPALFDEAFTRVAQEVESRKAEQRTTNTGT